MSGGEIVGEEVEEAREARGPSLNRGNGEQRLCHRQGMELPRVGGTIFEGEGVFAGRGESVIAISKSIVCV